MKPIYFLGETQENQDNPIQTNAHRWCCQLIVCQTQYIPIPEQQFYWSCCEMSAVPQVECPPNSTNLAAKLQDFEAGNAEDLLCLAE